MTHISNFKLFPLEIYVVLIDIITDTNKIKERPSRVEIRETMTETDLPQRRVSQLILLIYLG